MIEPRTLLLGEDREMPNNPVFPVLVYSGVLGPDVDDKARSFEERFAQNGWGGAWRDGIFKHHHFHPDAHEALGIARGSVEVQLGGDSGTRLALRAGDLLVLPAGTGHRNVTASSDLLVIGAYPPGQEDYSTCRSKVERDAMARVPRPRTDPFYGPDGPLLRHW